MSTDSYSTEPTHVPRKGYAWLEVTAGVWMFIGILGIVGGTYFALRGALGRGGMPDWNYGASLFLWGLGACTLGHVLGVGLDIARDAAVIRGWCERQAQSGQ